MLTLEEIHKGIFTELRTLDQLVDEVREAAGEQALAEADYKVSFARARLSIRALAEDKPTVGQVDDEAEERTKDERLRYLIASNRLTVCREALRASQAKLDGWRSLLSSFKLAGA
jgi:hypothetical protein